MKPLSIKTVGLSLGIFIGFTFFICVVFDTIFPGFAMYPVWERLLPGFKWLSLPAFFIGLVESFLYGWYIAVIFVPVYNFINKSK